MRSRRGVRGRDRAGRRCVAVPALPCACPGGDSCPPADDAIDLVPADALAYAALRPRPRHRRSTRRRQALAARVPMLSRAGRSAGGARLLPGPQGARLDFAPTSSPGSAARRRSRSCPAAPVPPQQVDLLEVGDADGAAEFADSVAAGTPRTATYDGVEVQVDRAGLATRAWSGGFSAIGTEERACAT